VIKLTLGRAILCIMAPYTLTKISDIFYFSCWTNITIQ